LRPHTDIHDFQIEIPAMRAAESRDFAHVTEGLLRAAGDEYLRHIVGAHGR
jgi:hypothetical protein